MKMKEEEQSSEKSLASSDDKIKKMNLWIHVIDWVLIIALISAVLYAKYTGKYDTIKVECEYMKPVIDGVAANITNMLNITLQ